MTSKFEKYSTPVSVLLGALFIAGAIYWSSANPRLADTVPMPVQDKAGEQKLDQMQAISATDHVRGNRNAEVFIVEYSDTECPFCKRFHETMKQVVEDYGANGKVAWVYRHFPLDSLHSKARGEAVALECANEQGGNDVFWKYADRLYEVTPSNNRLDETELLAIAQFVGLDAAAFTTCLSSGKYDTLIEAQVQNAIATGGNGTPWSIVVARNGTKYPLSGAQPLEAIKQLIDVALKAR